MSRNPGGLRLPYQMAQMPGFNRWIAFNLVGAMGVGVQLAVLAVLTRLFHADIIVATAVAVEAAILHNFAWHQRWTWEDRPSTGPRETGRRLVRFHAANGLVSLVGNVAITAALVRGLAMEPVIANAFAILACSLVNYAAGDLFVFRTPLIVASMLAGAATGLAALQPPAALAAWATYVAPVDQRLADASAPTFFTLDRLGVRGWRDRTRAGDVPMIEIEAPGIDEGKLHHWVGAVYVKGLTAEGVVGKLQAYAGRESEFYEEVTASRLLERQGDRVRVYLRLYRDAGPVEATYNTEHTVEYRRLSATRWTNRSVSTKIAEVASPGTPRERERAPGDDSGYLWKLNAYWRYEQDAGGVFIECESVSLSRSVPWLVRPIANPIVDRIARESLARTLRSVRAFLSR